MYCWRSKFTEVSRLFPYDIIKRNKSPLSSRRTSSVPPSFLCIVGVSKFTEVRETERRTNKHQKRGYHCLHGRKFCQTNSTQTLHLSVWIRTKLRPLEESRFREVGSQINHSGSCRLRSVSFMFPLNPVIYAGQWRGFYGSLATNRLLIYLCSPA